jgi:Ser/Thr protein kinase RdoA (MazF antagonist)
VIQRFENGVSRDRYHSLPTTIIHGDTNISNFLFDENGHITGIIDLLDAGRAPRIVDFTSILFKNVVGDNAYYNPENIEEIVKGYQASAKQPLSQAELEALPYFLLLEPLSFFMRLYCFGPSKYGDDLCARVVEYMKNVLNDIDNGFYQDIVDKYADKAISASNDRRYTGFNTKSPAFGINHPRSELQSSLYSFRCSQ